MQKSTEPGVVCVGEALTSRHEDNQFALIYAALSASAAFALYVILARLVF